MGDGVGTAVAAKGLAAFGPWGAAAGALLGGVGQAMAGGPQDLTMMTDARATMDGSGWVVSTGRGKSTGGDRRDEMDPATSMLGTEATSQAGGWLLPVLAIGGLLLWSRR